MDISRRAFVRNTAIGAAAAVAGGMIVGCSSNAQEGTDQQKPAEINLNGAEEREYDVVVIGSGSSGTTCSLTLAQAGCKVLMVEKTDHLGGLSNYSFIIGATETPEQREHGFDITTDFVWDYLTKYSGNSSNAPMVRKVIAHSGSTIKWLSENGLQLNYITGVYQGGMPDWQTFDGYTMGGPTYKAKDENFPSTGNLSGVHGTFVDMYGGEIMVNTAAVKVLQEEDGVVTGIALQAEDGSIIKVNAKAVVLACGTYSTYEQGFINAANTNQIVQRVPFVNEGDGIRLACEAGSMPMCLTPNNHTASICEFVGDETQPHPVSPLNNSVTFSLFHRTPLVMWINRCGERIANEELVSSFVRWSWAAYSHGGVFFEIFDQAQVDDFIKNGTPTEYTATTGTPSDYFGIGMYDGETETPVDHVGSKSGPAPKLQEELDAAAEGGSILKVNTIEELAEAIGCDLITLQETIDEYNAAISAKNDPLFLKDPQYLVYPIQQGPFYAVRAQTNAECGLMGGTFVNSNFQLLGKDTGQPIPNIYAVGANAGGMHGWNTYAEFSGLTMCYALNSGVVAAEHILKKYFS